MTFTLQMSYITNSILDKFNSFCQAQPANIKTQLTSILSRYYVPFIGGSFIKGKRASKDEIQEAFSFLSKITYQNLKTWEDTLNKSFTFFSVSNQAQRRYKYVFSLFIKFIESEDSNFKISKNEWNKFNKPRGNTRKIRHKNFKRKPNYGLMSHKSDYVNEKLSGEIKAYKAHLLFINNSPRTIEMKIEHIMYFLGWLHRFKNISYEDLSINKIIRHTPLNLKLELNYLDEATYGKYLIKKEFLKQKSFDDAKEDIKIIKEFLDFKGGSPYSLKNTVVMLICLAKFIYKDEIDSNIYEHNSVPHVKLLTNIRANLTERLKTYSDVVPFDEKSVDWNTALIVLDQVRGWATFQTSKQKRKKQAIANDLQRFLALSFLTLIPPDRRRTYVDLEIGKTMVYGEIKEGIFIKKERQQKNGSWFTYLQPANCKTGKFYGDSRVRIPNIVFPDNKNLYDYIDLWLDWGREYKYKCSHNYFFRGMKCPKEKKTYPKISGSSFYGWIRSIFENTVGVPVSIKEFRKMYITFLYRSNVSYELKQSAALAQHHSVQMQSKIYNQQSQDEKIEPIINFNQNYIENFFREKSAPDQDK